jgi:putative transposase
VGGAPRRLPATRRQRDWVHELANAQAGARKALAGLRDAPDRDHAQRAVRAFARDDGVKWPKAVAKPCDDAEKPPSFFDVPAEHWVHPQASNPIGFTFSPVRLRTRVAKGPGSRAAGPAVAFKLLALAQDRWPAFNGPHLAVLVRAGARFGQGVLVRRPSASRQAAA